MVNCLPSSRLRQSISKSQITLLRNISFQSNEYVPNIAGFSIHSFPVTSATPVRKAIAEKLPPTSANKTTNTPYTKPRSIIAPDMRKKERRIDKKHRLPLYPQKGVKYLICGGSRNPTG